MQSIAPPSLGPKKKARYGIFFSFFAAFYFLVPISLMIFNYTMDPYKRYHRIIPVGDLARLAKSSEVVLAIPSNHPDYNDRLLLEDYIPLISCPSVVILGGSCVMNIEGNVFGDRMADKVLNAGVSSGTVRDYIGIWQLLKEQNKIPGAVCLCLDAQSFYSNDYGQGWYTLSRYILRFQSQNRKPQFLKTCFQAAKKEIGFYLETLSSSDIARRSISALRGRQTEANAAYALRTHSMTLRQKTEERPQSAIDQAGKDHGEGEVRCLSQWGPRDERAIDEASSLVEDMRAHNVRVMVVLLPSHPLSYAYLKGHTKEHAVLLHLIEKMRSLSVAKQAFFYDALHEHRRDVSNSDFIDGAHLKRQASNAFFKHATAMLETRKP